MKTTLFIIILVAGMFSHAQNEISEPIVRNISHAQIGEKIKIDSKLLGIQKEISIGLPDAYSDTTEYPIIVVLEAELVFESFAALTRLMAKVNQIPPCIVVGIPFYNKHLEYAPKLSAHPKSGNADQMLNFYDQELFPLLDSMYNCKNERIIWAHSGLGGLFCTYILIGPDEQFNGILSSSPNLKLMDEYLNNTYTFDRLAEKDTVFYYLTIGSKETVSSKGEARTDIQQFKQSLEKDAPNNLIWKFQLNENNDHFTNAIDTYIDGLILYFQEFKRQNTYDTH